MRGDIKSSTVPGLPLPSPGLTATAANAYRSTYSILPATGRRESLSHELKELGRQTQAAS